MPWSTLARTPLLTAEDGDEEAWKLIDQLLVAFRGGAFMVALASLAKLIPKAALHHGGLGMMLQLGGKIYHSSSQTGSGSRLYVATTMLYVCI